MKTISCLLAGVAAALAALLAHPGELTWRSGAVAGVAFIGGLGIPAVHSIGGSAVSPPESSRTPDGATAAGEPI
jgi:hypothetical protein